MPYVPRSPTPVCCAHCGQVFAARHARRRYCSHSCNVRASYARNGRRRPGPAPLGHPQTVTLAGAPLGPAAPEVILAPATAAAQGPAAPTPRPLLEQLVSFVDQVLQQHAAEQASRARLQAAILGKPPQ
jgi:hypothetical protein